MKTDSSSSDFSKLTRTTPPLLQEIVSLTQQCAQGNTLHLSRGCYIQHSSIPALSDRTDLIYTAILLHFPTLWKTRWVFFFSSFHDYAETTSKINRIIMGKGKVWKLFSQCLFNDTKMVHLPSFFSLYISSHIAYVTGLIPNQRLLGFEQ